jgi:hypothetical protein
VSKFASIICNLFLLILYAWYFSSVFKCFIFLCVLIMSTVSVMVPYLCPVFNMWFEYTELLFLIACIRSSAHARSNNTKLNEVDQCMLAI